MEEGCIFCKIVKGEMESEKVMESENFVVIRDAYPKLEGHSLILPKKHFEDFMKMDRELDSELLSVARDVANKEGWEEFNLVTNNGKAAGQVVWHTHFHILPRREGDGFRIGI